MFSNIEQIQYTCSELEKEAEADAVLYRNTFGTQPRKPWGPLQNAFDLYLKNPANTNVVLWGNRLLALWEVCCQATKLSCLCLTNNGCILLMHYACAAGMTCRWQNLTVCLVVAQTAACKGMLCLVIISSCKVSFLTYVRVSKSDPWMVMNCCKAALSLSLQMQ